MRASFSVTPWPHGAAMQMTWMVVAMSKKKDRA
jgi:hypothetical protein